MLYVNIHCIIQNLIHTCIQYSYIEVPYINVLRYKNALDNITDENQVDKEL